MVFELSLRVFWFEAQSNNRVIQSVRVQPVFHASYTHMFYISSPQAVFLQVLARLRCGAVVNRNGPWAGKDSR